MPRTARIVVPEIPHHITQRGNNHQDVFFVDDDRIEYLRLLKQYSREYGLTIDGYCLMTNHIHLIATPYTKSSLALAIGRSNLVYTQYVNRMHGRCGHLWQNRFYSVPLSNNYFWTALRYIEHNPIRAKLCRYAWTYPWSSAAAHTGEGDRSNILDMRKWIRESDGLDWKKILTEQQEDENIKAFRNGRYKGLPLGSDSFISKLEVRIGCRLRPNSRGRPKKTDKNKERNKK